MTRRFLRAKIGVSSTFHHNHHIASYSLADTCLLLLTPSEVSKDSCWIRHACLAQQHVEIETPTPLDPHIGRTNAVLDDDQASRVRAHLVGAQKELQQWDRQLAILLAHRARVADRVYRCNVALAPYKRLPVELTREIIFIAVGVPSSLPLPKETALDPRLQVTQVCADWRQIAFDTPELWKLVFSRIPEGSESSACKLANAWWSQCSGPHLSLAMSTWYIYNRIGRYTGIQYDHSLLKQIITPHSTRLVELQLVLRTETVKGLFALSAGSFQALKTLLIRVKNDTVSPCWSDGLGTAFSSSPYLSNVTLHAGSLKNPQSLPIPWSQLKEFKLFILNSALSAGSILSVLSQCPLLRVSCNSFIENIDTNLINQISAKWVVPLPLKELTVLRVDFNGSKNHGHFLRMLSLPRLSTLQIYCRSFWQWDLSDYTTFLQGVAPTLKRFQLYDSDPMPSWDENPPCFQFDKTVLSCMPHLLIFTVPENHFIGPHILEEMASGGLLPSVTTVEFSVSGSDLELAIDMVKARLSHPRDSQASISVIRKVVLKCPNPTYVGNRLNFLKEQGVNIEIKMHSL